MSPHHVRWYTPVPSPPALDSILACSWTAVPTGRHRLVPDACMDLVWLSTGPLVLCGPEHTAWDFALPDGTTSVGIRFRPGAVPRLLGVDASTMLDRRVPLDALVTPAVATELGRRMDEAGGDRARINVLEAFAADLVDASTTIAHDDGFADRVLDVLASSPRANAARLAAQLGITTRQLHRRSMTSFGYGTATLARLLRFQRFLAVIDGRDVPTPLARAAVEAGYSDQAHLGRDCRAITQQTPTAFLADYFATFPDMSDPYKTASPLATTMTA